MSSIDFLPYLHLSNKFYNRGMLVFQPSTDERPSFIYRLIRAIQYITAMQRENERLCGIHSFVYLVLKLFFRVIINYFISCSIREMIIYFLLIVCFIHDNSSISFVSLCNYDGLILFKAFDGSFFFNW